MSDVRVRRREGGRELLVGGTSASFYRPGRVLTGGVWDALAAPLLVLPPERRRELLLLGLGGGSAARVMRALAPTAHLVGVDHDPAVVAVARAHFDLDAIGIDVRVADMRAFVDEERAVYDFVVEDCFAGGALGLEKPAWLLEGGLDAIAARLAPGGIFVCNVVHGAPAFSAALAARYASLLRIEHVECTNQIFVASDCELRAGALRQIVRREPALRATLPLLRFRSLR